MRAKKLLTSRQIFRDAVPARTVTKKHCVVLGLLENISLNVIASLPYCIEVEHTIFAIAVTFV